MCSAGLLNNSQQSPCTKHGFLQCNSCVAVVLAGLDLSNSHQAAHSFLAGQPTSTLKHATSWLASVLAKDECTCWPTRMVCSADRQENASTGASMECGLDTVASSTPPYTPASQLHTVHLPQCTCGWTSQHWRIAAVQAQNSKQSTLLFGRQYIPELTLYELVAVPSCDSYGRCFQPSHPGDSSRASGQYRPYTNKTATCFDASSRFKQLQCKVQGSPDGILDFAG